MHSTQVKPAKTIASLKININEKHLPTITKINLKTLLCFFSANCIMIHKILDIIFIQRQQEFSDARNTSGNLEDWRL